MHDLITVGVPLIAILFGILFNRQGLNDLRTEMKLGLSDLRTETKQGLSEQKGELQRAINDLKVDLKAEIRASEDRLSARVFVLERDYREFYKTQAQLESRVDSIQKAS